MMMVVGASTALPNQSCVAGHTRGAAEAHAATCRGWASPDSAATQRDEAAGAASAHAERRQKAACTAHKELPQWRCPLHVQCTVKIFTLTQRTAPKPSAPAKMSWENFLLLNILRRQCSHNLRRHATATHRRAHPGRSRRSRCRPTTPHHRRNQPAVL